MRHSTIQQRPETFLLNYDHPLANGLVFAGLGNASGSNIFFDSSFYQNHGRMQNMNSISNTTWYSALNRKAIYFDTSLSNYIALPSRANLILGSGDFSVALWYFYMTGETGAVLISAGDTNATEWMLREAGLLWFYANAGSISANISTSSYILTHVCAYRSGSTLVIYVNGVGATQDVSASGDISTTKSITIGGNGTVRSMNGYVIDPLIYKRVLSEREIKQLADPQNIMLSGLIQPPKRKFYTIYSSPNVPSAQRYHLIFKQNNKYLKFGVRM